MLSKKTIEAMSYAFEMERSSYQRTILDMKHKIESLDKNKDYNEQMLTLRDATIEQLELKIHDLENIIKESKEIGSEDCQQLKLENDKLKAELQETKATLKKYMASSAGLNAKQKLEYKRLKQNEYQRRWLKNKAKKNK